MSSFRIGNRPEALLKLLGGGRRTALILNADDDKAPADRQASLQREIDELSGAGLEPVEVDLREYFGRQEALREALAGFDAIYVRGGNVFILRRALLQSGADEMIRDLLARDAVVYAGYSAGPCMLGRTLRGIEGAEDDPEVVPDGYEAEVVWDGLGVLQCAIVPHHEAPTVGGEAAARLVRQYTDQRVPFLTLRDGEALVVDGDSQRIVG